MTEQIQDKTENDKDQPQQTTGGYTSGLGEIFKYYFRKKDTKNINTRMMHGINKISIIMFLIAFVIIVGRFIVRAL
ncbi:MAG: hypothetical protein JXQ90_03270 [Cyclobacteriaceae bacterium]